MQHELPKLGFKPHHIPLLFTNPPQKWSTLRVKPIKAGEYRIMLGAELYGTVEIQPDYQGAAMSYLMIADKLKLALAEGYTSLEAFEHMLYNFNSRGKFCYRDFLAGGKRLYVHRIVNAKRNNNGKPLA